MRKVFLLLLIFSIVGCTGQERNYIPGAALADDLETLSFSIKDGYRNQHPRLLFSEDDKSELLTKRKKAPEVWRLVTESADIYLKNLQMVLFFDSGRTWQNGDTIDLSGFNVSVGVGARLNMFILQQYPMVLRLDYTAQLSDFNNNRISLSIGPTF